MNIIHHIAKKELLESWRDHTLRFLGSILFIFLVVSLMMGWVDYRRMYAEKQKAKQVVRDQWVNQGEKNPHGAGHFGMMAFKPVNSLAIVEKGMNRYLGQWIYLETHNRNDAEKKPAKDATSLLRFGELTPAFLLQFLMPLIVILLCYASFSKEKENATLRMVMSQGISANVFIIGKCLGSIYKLLLVLLPAFLTFFLFAFISIGIDRFIFLTSAVMAVSYFIFFLIFSFIATGVSLLCSSSKKSLLFLFFFWIMGGMFIPRLTASVSERIYPTPSSFEFKRSFENAQGNKYLYGYKGLDSFRETYKKVQHELMDQYQVKHPDSLPVNVFGFAIENTEEEGQQLFDKSYGELNRIFEKQAGVYRYSALLSPFSAIRFLSMGLSHSGNEEHKHFNDEVENYRREVMKTLNMDIAYHSKQVSQEAKKRKGSSNYTRGRDLWESIPDFTYNPLSFHEILRNHRLDMLILAGWLIISLLFLFATSYKLKTL